MNFPKFPCIELAKYNAERMENPLVESFLQNFISQLVNGIEFKLMITSIIMNIHRTMKSHSWKHLATN